MQSLASDLSGLLEWFKVYYKKSAPDRDKEYLELLNLISEICVGVWRTKGRLLEKQIGDPIDEVKRVLRPIDSIISNLNQAGFDIQDKTNRPYSIGMMEKVISWDRKITFKRIDH